MWPPASGERGEWWPAHNSQGQRPAPGIMAQRDRAQSFNHQPASHVDTIWNKRGIIYGIPGLLWLISWCCLEHGHDDNVHIYVYIISTTLTMSAASAPLHTYVLRAWLSWLLMRGEREWLERPPWGSSPQDTHLTAKFRKLRDELQRNNEERGAASAGNKNIVLSFHVSVELI